MCILRMLGEQYIAKQAGCALPAVKNITRRLLSLCGVASSKDRVVPSANSAQRSNPR